MTSERFLRSAVMAGGMILGIASASRGANLVKNPTFLGSISPWTASPSASVSLNSLDEAGSPASGSGRVTASGAIGIEGTLQQCLTIDPSVHYRFSADVLFPTGQIPANATAFVYGYASSNCTGPFTTSNGVTLSNQVYPRDTWQHLRNGNAFVNDPSTHSVNLYLGVYKTDNSSGSVVANFDNVVFEPGDATGPCVPNSYDLCLSGFRYRVEVLWETSDANSTARAVQLNEDSGVFTFFDPDNVELQLKVLNACPFAHRYWVFASGTTNVGVTINVLDTKTGTTKTYSNAVGHPFTPILDTDAFATCP